jgi:hypothetical protein
MFPPRTAFCLGKESPEKYWPSSEVNRSERAENFDDHAPVLTPSTLDHLNLNSTFVVVNQGLRAFSAIDVITTQYPPLVDAAELVLAVIQSGDAFARQGD